MSTRSNGEANTGARSASPSATATDPVAAAPADDTDRPGTWRRLGPRFWSLWAANTVSSIGDGLTTVALPLLAAALTRQPLAVAAVLFLTRLPWLMVAIPAGAYADKTDRPRLMRRMDVIRALLLGAVAVLVATSTMRLAMLYVFAFLLGTCETFFSGAAQAVLPSLVSRGRLAQANSLLSVGETATEQTIGPAVGGALFAASATAPFAADAVSFVGSAILLRGVSLPIADGAAPGTGDAGSRDVVIASRSNGAALDAEPGRRRVRNVLAELWHDMRSGLAWYRRSRSLCLVTGTVGVLAFCQAMVMGVLVLFALEHLHLSGTGYGVFMAAMALGNVVGGLIAARAVRRFGVTGVVVAATVLASVGYLGTAMTMSPFLAAALLALEGVAVIIGNVATISFRQALVPDELQARVANVWRTVIYGAIPLGALAGGGVAAAWGLRMPFVVGGVVQLVLAAIVARPLQRLVGTGAAAGVVG